MNYICIYSIRFLYLCKLVMRDTTYTLYIIRLQCCYNDNI